MSDTSVSQAGAVPGTATAHDAVAAGLRIRQAREAAGLHVVALAAALKVPVKKLEALETGRTADLPDATFARALAASVCRQLKVDPSEVLALLPQVAGSRLGEDQVLKTPFRSPREPVGAAVAASGVPKAVWLALSILLMAAVVWWFVPPMSQRVSTVESPSAGASTESGTSMGAVTSVAQETTAAPSDGQAAAASPHDAATTTPPPSVVAAPVLAAGVPVTPAAPAIPAPAAPSPTSATSATSAVPAAGVVSAAADVLVIRATSDSWVEVTAGGRVLLQRVIKAGESVTLGDAPPLMVVVGRVDATEVLVRGKVFDMSTVARSNVARFEVK